MPRLSRPLKDDQTPLQQKGQTNLSLSATAAAALLTLYQVIKLPYTVAICSFILLALLVYLSRAARINLLNYIAFYGLLALSAIMRGYYADVKGVGGTIVPQLIVGSIGTLLIIFEELKSQVRR